MKRTPLSKIGKSDKAKLEKAADRLLQTYITTKYPRCELCGQQSQCGHHFIEKSKSNRLRYHEPNIIPVCLSCHSKIHNRFSFSIQSHDIIEDIIIKRGKKWRNELDKLRKEIVKTNEDYYQNAIQEYTEKINQL